MSLDTLDELEWWEIARQSAEIGFCLVEPEEGWRPASAPADADEAPRGRRAHPAADRQLRREGARGDPERAADRRDLRRRGRPRPLLHARRASACSRAAAPSSAGRSSTATRPSSVDTVERILEAFRAGTQDRAAFWIELRGRFVHIEYVALRDAAGAYLGCLEVTQDLTEKRALTGRAAAPVVERGDGRCLSAHATITPDSKARRAARALAGARGGARRALAALPRAPEPGAPADRREGGDAPPGVGGERRRARRARRAAPRAARASRRSPSTTRAAAPRRSGRRGRGAGGARAPTTRARPSRRGSTRCRGS